MTNTIVIDGIIGRGAGEVSKAFVAAQLATANPSQPLEVRIHSEGGNVFEGFAIYDLFKAYEGQKKCVIASSAFSIASFIAMAFDDVEITPNGYMMVHDPYVEVEGREEELANQAELLRSLKSNMIAAYAAKTGKTPEEMQEVLRKETYLSASQAMTAGFVNRVTDTPVVGRVFAQLHKMPHGVVAALFGAASSGNEEPPKEKPMADSQPVAATIQEIKTAFPKAKADFIVRCLEKSMPMASVAQAAVEEMMAENANLVAKVAAMEEELAKFKAMSPSEETPSSEEMVEEEEESPMPAAKARGHKPVAVAKPKPVPNARKRWDDAVAEQLKTHNNDRVKAVKAANKLHPGLREEMLSEVNS